MTNILTKIWSGIVAEWDAAEALINKDVAAVRAALPASAQGNLDTFVADVKQGASDAISIVNTGFQASALTVSKAIEAALDAELATLSNGAALPLVPLVNTGIDDLTSIATSTANAWALKAKAALAPPVTPPAVAPTAPA